jgi:hypothetical protein
MLDAGWSAALVARSMLPRSLTVLEIPTANMEQTVLRTEPPILPFNLNFYGIFHLSFKWQYD